MTQSEQADGNVEAQVGWPEVAAASAEIEANAALAPRRSKMAGAIRVKVSDASKAKAFVASVKDDAEKAELEEELDARKADVKDLKDRIEIIEKRMSARFNDGRGDHITLIGNWIREDDFRRNATLWFDADTGVLVSEEAMDPSARQTELGFNGGSTTDAPPPASESGVVAGDDDGPDYDGEDAPEDGGGEDATDEANAHLDSTTNLSGDPDEPVIDDPAGVLNGDAATPTTDGKTPAKPSRRGRKAK